MVATVKITAIRNYEYNTYGGSSYLPIFAQYTLISEFHLLPTNKSNSPSPFEMTPVNKYRETHLSPNGPGDSRPTAEEILKDEGLEGKLSDKVFLVTGASAGIGVETVRVLARTGATVFAAARDLEKAGKALAGFEGEIELIKLDLASLASVREAAKEFLKRSDEKLNVLVNNAGVMAIPSRTVTADGYEAQFGTNHLGKMPKVVDPVILPSFVDLMLQATSYFFSFSNQRFCSPQAQHSILASLS